MGEQVAHRVHKQALRGAASEQSDASLRRGRVELEGGQQGALRGRRDGGRVGAVNHRVAWVAKARVEWRGRGHGFRRGLRPRCQCQGLLHKGVILLYVRENAPSLAREQGGGKEPRSREDGLEVSRGSHVERGEGRRIASVGGDNLEARRTRVAAVDDEHRAVRLDQHPAPLRRLAGTRRHCYLRVRLGGVIIVEPLKRPRRVQRVRAVDGRGRRARRPAEDKDGGGHCGQGSGRGGLALALALARPCIEKIRVEVLRSLDFGEGQELDGNRRVALHRRALGEPARPDGGLGLGCSALDDLPHGALGRPTRRVQHPFFPAGQKLNGRLRAFIGAQKDAAAKHGLAVQAIERDLLLVSGQARHLEDARQLSSLSSSSRHCWVSAALEEELLGQHEGLRCVSIGPRQVQVVDALGSGQVAREGGARGARSEGRPDHRRAGRVVARRRQGAREPGVAAHDGVQRSASEHFKRRQREQRGWLRVSRGSDVG